MMEIGDYTWIFAVGMVIAFFDAYGIGANDVANSFATSVSSGSLSLAQACIVASFTEFLGAVLLGAETTDTIKGGILSVSHYESQPEMLMLAMFCALFGSATWVLCATKFGWPVSTTHSIVGAIIGVGISAFGASSIDWEWSGVAQIITSWFVSPIAAGIVAAIIYMITKYAILRQVESFKWGIRLVPVYFFFTAAIEAFYIIYKAPGGGGKSLGVGVVIGIAIGVAVVCAAFGQFFFCPWVVRKIKGRENLKFYHIFVIPFLSKRPTIDEVDIEEHAATRPTITVSSSSENLSDAAVRNEMLTPPATDTLKKLNTDTEVIQAEDINICEKSDSTCPSPALEEAPAVKTNWFKSKAIQAKNKAVDMAMSGVRQDVRNLDNQKLSNIHSNAEIFEDDAEYLFSFLQVITACMASFAHGSNDVSNAIGPISSIYEVWTTAEVGGKVAVPVWILAYGGIAIDIGLATMGYRLMRSLGNNITFFTPSRGFCAELAAALTVLTCSQIGLPVSTTHCILGASAAIGMCNTNGYKAVNWKMLGWCLFSCLVTLPCAGTLAGLLFALCANAPKFL
jgi:phosphate/sulfate permease